MKKILISLAVVKKIITLVLLFTFFACTGFLAQAPDWIATGPVFPAYHGKMDLFSDFSEIKRPYGNVGMARMRNVEQKHADIKAAVQTMAKFAASKGGTGVVISQQGEGEPGSGKVMVIGYVVKYVDTLTEKDKEAIEEFNLIGVIDEYSGR